MQQCLLHPTGRRSQDRIQLQEGDSYVRDEYIHLNVGTTDAKLYIVQHCMPATSNDTESFCQSVYCCRTRLTVSSQHESMIHTDHRALQSLGRAIAPRGQTYLEHKGRWD